MRDVEIYDPGPRYDVRWIPERHGWCIVDIRYYDQIEIYSAPFHSEFRARVNADLLNQKCRTPPFDFFPEDGTLL